MTIKPKRKKSGRDFGTRRQWRRVWRDRAWPLWMLDAHKAIGTQTGRWGGRRIMPDIKMMPVPEPSPYAELGAKIHQEIEMLCGLDVGREDATALVVCDYSGTELRILAHYVGDEIRLPTNEELLAEFPATRSDPYSDLALAMGFAFGVDKPRKLGKSPALVAPYGSPKDSG